MGIFKAIFGVIFKLRDWVQGKFGELFNNFRDPSTGKLNFGRPSTVRTIGIIVALILFFIVLASQFFTNESKIGGGRENFEKEVAPTTGVSSIGIHPIEEDPFKNITSISRDQYGTNSNVGGKDFTGLTTSSDNPLSVAQCVNIVDKLKANTALTTDETALAKECIAQNPMGLTADEMKFATAMLDPNSTPAEKALLAKALAGTATEEELAVAKSLTTGTDAEKALARAAIASGDPTMVAALGKQLTGKQLTADEQAKLSALKTQVANGTAGGVGSGGIGGVNGVNGTTTITAAPGIPGAPGTAGALTGGGTSTGQVPVSILPGLAAQALDGLPSAVIAAAAPLRLPAAPDEALKALAQDVGSRENAISDLEKQVAQAQLRTSAIAEKLASGRQITPAETDQMQGLIKVRKQLESLRQVQEQRKTEFAKRANALQASLAQSVQTVQQNLAAGTFIEYEGTSVDCNKVKALPVRRKTGGPRVVVAKKGPEVLDIDGRPLRPEEVEFIKLQRRNQADMNQAKNDAVNPGPKGLGTPLSPTGADGQQAGITDMNQLFVFRDNSLKAFELTADMKIPAALDSEILVSDKGAPQTVRVRILQDVQNPATNEIIIPRGSIAIATTSGFDKDTGIMNLTFDKVIIGSGKTVPVKLNAGSANGYTGVRGEIHDTTGKYLLGAFVTSFSSGILSAISQQYISPYQQSTSFADNAAGAGLAGASEVGNRIAQLYASKLQNAAVVFWVPKGIPLVLTPQ